MFHLRGNAVAIVVILLKMLPLYFLLLCKHMHHLYGTRGAGRYISAVSLLVFFSIFFSRDPPNPIDKELFFLSWSLALCLKQYLHASAAVNWILLLLSCVHVLLLTTRKNRRLYICLHLLLLYFSRFLFDDKRFFGFCCLFLSIVSSRLCWPYSSFKFFCLAYF